MPHILYDTVVVAYSLVCMTLYGKSPLTSLEDTLGGTLEDTLVVDSLEDMGDISLYKNWYLLQCIHAYIALSRPST